jgi:hypothetical protein
MMTFAKYWPAIPAKKNRNKINRNSGLLFLQRQALLR